MHNSVHADHIIASSQAAVQAEAALMLVAGIV